MVRLFQGREFDFVRYTEAQNLNGFLRLVVKPKKRGYLLHGIPRFSFGDVRFV